jgi:hypothetical protein
MTGGGASEVWSPWAEALWAALRDGAPLSGAALQRLLDGLSAEPPEAVWHPTGFVVLSLRRRDDGALRLHLWPAGARELGRPCWPVHDHVWGLRSQVLSGCVESREYAVVDDDDGDAVLYAVRYGEGRSSCMRRSARRVRVREQAPRRIAAGERYEIPAGAFHASTVAIGDFAATLAATRPTTQRWPWVVGELDGPTLVSVERPAVEVTRARELLERVRTTLDGIRDG